MITAFAGPLIVEPESWVLVFERDHPSRWVRWLALGRYKHVRAYGYVPFLHVWIFYDVHLRGTSIVVAADGEPANRVIACWIAGADLVRMPRRPPGSRRMPVFGWCVPSIKRLIGLRCVALRPDGLYRSCLRHGGVPFEGSDGISPPVPAASADAGVHADAAEGRRS